MRACGGIVTTSMQSRCRHVTGSPIGSIAKGREVGNLTAALPDTSRKAASPGVARAVGPWPGGGASSDAAGMFRVTATDGAARAGVLTSAHGEVRTPVFMPVGTKATVKTLHPDEVREL